MSGHNKWSQIRRQKGVNDLKKGQIYTKIAKQIVMSVKQGGGDPDINFALKMAINKGKIANMPTDSIEKAIKKGLGEDKNANLIESVTYETYGFGGATLLVDVLTDNRNRSAADVRLLIEKNGGRNVEAGSLSWQYKTLGLLTLMSENDDEKRVRIDRKWNEKVESRKIPSSEDLIDEFEMLAIDIDGVEDVLIEKEDGIYLISIYTELDKLDAVRKAISEIGYDVDQSEIIKKAEMEVEVSEEDMEKNQKLIEALEENDDVGNVWHNIKGL